MNNITQIYKDKLTSEEIKDIESLHNYDIDTLFTKSIDAIEKASDINFIKKSIKKSIEYAKSTEYKSNAHNAVIKAQIIAFNHCTGQNISTNEL